MVNGFIRGALIIRAHKWINAARAASMFSNNNAYLTNLHCDTVWMKTLPTLGTAYKASFLVDAEGTTHHTYVLTQYEFLLRRTQDDFILTTRLIVAF